MPRMGSPNAAARSFLSTSCRLRLAALRARACASAYGSCRRFRCVSAEAWDAAEEVKVREMGADGGAGRSLAAMLSLY